jgi:hypothetical protein
MNQDLNNRKTSAVISVFCDEKYQDFVDKVSYKNFCEEIKNNQGITIKEICDVLGGEKSHCETLLNVWTKNWNTFYHCGGRLVNKKGRYYILSPRNPQSRARNPEINLI